MDLRCLNTDELITVVEANEIRPFRITYKDFVETHTIASPEDIQMITDSLTGDEPPVGGFTYPGGMATFELSFRNDDGAYAQILYASCLFFLLRDKGMTPPEAETFAQAFVRSIEVYRGCLAKNIDRIKSLFESKTEEVFSDGGE